MEYTEGGASQAADGAELTEEASDFVMGELHCEGQSVEDPSQDLLPDGPDPIPFEKFGEGDRVAPQVACNISRGKNSVDTM